MRRATIILTMLITGCLLALGLTTTQAADHDLTNNTKPSFWVLSDPHFIAPSLHDQQAAFKQITQTAADRPASCLACLSPNGFKKAANGSDHHWRRNV